MQLPIDSGPVREWIETFLPTPEGALHCILGDDIWRAPKSASRPHALRWSLMRELWRPLDPAIEEPHGAARQPLIECLGVPPQGPREAGVLPPRLRRFSTSTTLSSKIWREAARARFGFLSAFDDRAWASVDSGWERHEFEHRKEEAKRREMVISEIEAQWPAGVSALQDVTRSEKLKLFEQSPPDDAHRRMRAWKIWLDLSRQPAPLNSD